MPEYSKHSDTLWAPWRLSYIKGNDDTAVLPDPDRWRPGADKSCFLCRAAALPESYDRDLGVVARTDQSVVILNRYPYTNGHLLIAPLQHQATLSEIDASVLLDLQQLLAIWCQRLTRTLEAQGFNIGLNLGKVAGAGVEEHLHFHIVPRWFGDTNAFTVFADVRVIPEHLKATCDNLKVYFDRLDSTT